MTSIVIASGKGGVGKTTSAINLGACFNALNKEVIVVDANITTPDIGVSLGAPIVPISLQDVLAGTHKPHEAIYSHHSGTKILPASLSGRHVIPERLADVIKALKKRADLVIIDSAAGLGRDALAALQAADELIVIANPELLSLTSALKTIRMAKELGKSVRGVIITRVGSRHQLSIDNMAAMLEQPVIGIIPEDSAVKKALLMRDAVVHTHPRSKAARAYMEIASRLLGKHEKENFFAGLLKKLGL